MRILIHRNDKLEITYDASGLSPACQSTLWMKILELMKNYGVVNKPALAKPQPRTEAQQCSLGGDIPDEW